MTATLNEAPVRTPNKTVTIEISNTCTCVFCPGCVMVLNRADECECGETDLELADCGGGCYEEGIDALRMAFEEWVVHNPSPEGFYRIEGSGMGWRGLSGTKVIRRGDCLSQAIGINDEWVQGWSVDMQAGGALTASQSHHDAMGESYTVTAIAADEVAEAMSDYYNR